MTAVPAGDAPDAAQRALDAAGLAPDEMRLALLYLCGWAPDGVRAAVACVLRSRRAAAQVTEDNHG